MAKINLNLVSVDEAKAISNTILGVPSDNRVLILSPLNAEKSTKSGILIPGSTEEGVPRKGVVIKSGYLSDEFKHYESILKVGNVITFGLYAGKEIDPLRDCECIETPEGNIFSVLSISEIIFIEPNTNE